MTTELTLLAWTLVLALVQILLPAAISTRRVGLTYKVGPRDMPDPDSGAVTSRLRRAQANLFETLPLFAAGILIAHIADRNGVLTEAGAYLYFLGRLAYLPLYAAGVPYLRTVVWMVAILGLVLVLLALLMPA
ncbi:MAPEG family protein [Ancylobacter sp. MQZ15Z-1]|uniref:MAPEG family protein n=1 Tax=Ancylobacter mangrovi TaxID=2972472 RepID=A0A9X2PFG8_9HYPH|nr:MAPEG family protein [Ancylobacter mangrovi]MCS0496414.1 MAPEG family protein [Ancylobacter mangrovi]